MTDKDLVRLTELIETASANGVARLPAEPLLSEQLGMSRGRLRTLLKLLERDGLIWRHVGKGTFVGPRHIALPEGPGTGSTSMGAWIRARLLLEPQLAAQAALHSTKIDILEMHACLKDMRSAQDYVSWKRLDNRLHRTIAEATHNLLLLTLHDTLHLHGRVTLDERIAKAFSSEHGARRMAIDQHCALIDAISQHDPPAAEEAMRAHLQSVRRKLIDYS